MSLARCTEVCRLELRSNLTRPVFWILLAVMALVSWGLSTGGMQISSGDATVGGTKAFITSEFAYAQIITIFDFLILSMFFAVLAGLPVVRDEEAKVQEVLHATPMRASEYIWGKFLGVFAVFLLVSLAHALFAMFFNHVVPNAEAAEIQGPLVVMNYLRPTVLLGLPGLLFVAGVCFTIGTVTRKPILVFMFPIALLLVCGMFLWEWSPSWLAPGWNRVLMWVDPSGLRWLNETWLKVDQGVEFYNHRSVPIDLGFGLSRLLLASLGLGLVGWTARRFGQALRGQVSHRERTGLLASTASFSVDVIPPATRTRPLADLAMTTRPVSFVRSARAVAGAEARGLVRHPGLYLFAPVIVLQVLGNAVFSQGAFDVDLLHSTGSLAVRSLGLLSVLGLFLMMFYTVESLHRERAAGMAPIHFATSVSTAAHLTGKLFGVALVSLVLIGATVLGCVIALAYQGKVPIEFTPFAVIFGLLGVPTFIVFCAFMTAVFALTNDRMTSYAIGLGVLAWTWYKIWFGGEMTWVWNWPLWNVIEWSDISRLEMNGEALLINRLLVISASVFFLALAARVFSRREFDATRTLHRLQPKRLLRSTLSLLPFAMVTLVLGGYLSHRVDAGFQGDAAKKAQKDYWRRNVRTWTDVVPPHIAGADVTVDLFPSEKRIASQGSLVIRNGTAVAMTQFAVTPGPHWEDVTWTLDGAEVTPDNRAGLMVMTPATPLLPGATTVLGYSMTGFLPRGMTKNGGGASEFVMPSGVVLTSFTPSFVPVLGFQEGVGVDKDNKHDAREYPDDFYHGVTRNAFGGGPAYDVRTTIRGPAGWTLNGVGVVAMDEVKDGRRTVVWESDHPVTFFNVVAGPLEVREGVGTAIYYNAAHEYNIDEMIVALDAARKFYSEWFYPYPWERLKITEFPALAGYAQGFASNISFSESIGFMTKSDPKANTAFMVTAHESAHQWWGNILQPGEGPGGNILSEGMAHFSTALLFEAVNGPYQRMEFMRGIEDRYGESRVADSERAMVKIDGSRPGDTTVTYDKGGWVFWMLLRHLGRDHGLQGYREFIERYKDNEDHPVLQDFVVVMREFALDVPAFDAFADQWFFSVVVPEYRVRDARSGPAVVLAGSGGAGGEADEESAGGATYEVRATIENVGTGVMPVDIAVTNGDRYQEIAAVDPDATASADAAASAAAAADAKNDDDGDQHAERDRPRVKEVGMELRPDYREARVTLTLAAGASEEIVVVCDFEPKKIVVDPDVMVLQLKRKAATADL